MSKHIYLADKFNIFSFNILDNHNFHFCQEMKSQITNSIPVEKTPKLEIETQGKKKIKESLPLSPLSVLLLSSTFPMNDLFTSEQTSVLTGHCTQPS